MKPAHFIIILLIAFSSGCGVPGLSHKSSPLIGGIAPSETMEVEYSSVGCFHRSHYKLAFTRLDGRIRVTGVDLFPPAKRRLLNRSEGKEMQLGPKTLSKHEIIRLDRLLAYYRKPSDSLSVSTTSESIKITHRTSAGIVGTESYSDHSGGIYDQWGLLTIPDLVSKMQPEDP